ncbi:MAG: DUF6049 family protein [Ornithinimicrobium sp.]
MSVLLVFLIGVSSPLTALPALAVSAAAVPSQDASEVELTLNQVVPTVLRPGQSWAVQGRVENVSDVTVQVEEVRLLTAYRALDTDAALDGWVSGDDAGETTELAGSADLSRTLDPGQGRDFYVVVSGETIAPPFTFASLPLRLEVRAADGSTPGELRTVLPWFGDTAADDPLDVSWVLPLTVPPDPDLTAETGSDRTRAWLDVVGEESSTRAWLAGLSAYDATFLVDPSLLVPLAPAADVSAAPEPIPLPEPTTSPPDSTATDPNLPASDPSDSPGATGDAEGSPDDLSAPSGLPVPEDAVATLDVPDDLTQVQEAELALQRQLADLETDQLWWLPVADPDVAAMIDVGVDADVVDAVLGAPLPPSVLDADRLLERGRQDVTWPLWPRLSRDQLGDLTGLSANLDVSTTVVPRSAFTDGEGRNARPNGFTATATGEVTLLGYDESLSALVSNLPEADSDGEQIQLLLARTLARYQRSPADPGAVVIAPTRDAPVDPRTAADLGEALAVAPWITQVPADPLLGAGGAVSLTGDSASVSPADSPLTSARVARIESVRSTLAQLAAVVPRGGAVEQWEPILNSLYSARWRENPDGWSVPLTELETQVATIIDGVSINPTTVNFLAEEGLIQITIVNDLPITVQDLSLDLVPGNGRLRIIEEPGPITIGPQSRATVQFRARAVAAGEVPVRASLSAPSGLQIGEMQEVGVQVRPTGIWIYWVLGGVAGVILILGLARAIRRPPAAAGPASPAERTGS